MFDLLLQVRGLDFYEDPVAQSLQRTGVAKAMSRDCSFLPRTTNIVDALKITSKNPQWICIQDGKTPIALVRGVDLIQYLQKEKTERNIDLMEIPAKRLQVSCIDVRATMAKARDVFKQENSEALCVTHWNSNSTRYVYGVLTRDQFEQLYMR